MDAKFNYIVSTVANSAIAYVIVVSLLKFNGFKIDNNSKLRLSRVVKRLVINFLIYKLILVKFGIINFWIDYAFSFDFILTIYIISVIITVTKIITSSKNKTIFSVLSVN